MAAFDVSSTLYFGYGSNLWLHQMAQRCPTSTYEGIAHLPDYRWMINSRGYANVVEASTPVSGNRYNNVVFGLVYTLLEEDEERLDRNEGVPYCYTKEDLEVDFWPSRNESESVDVSKPSEKRKMLVYIDRERIKDSVPKEEYIYRMNMGIKDAVKLGVPEQYVDRVMRKFIPEKDGQDVQQFAMKQALAFEDER